MITESDARRNIAANLRRILDERRMKQTDLAKRSGESDMTVSRLLRGQNAPTITILANVAEALDVSIDRLISVPPENFEKKIPVSA